jgi:hypothetical protein
MDAQTLKEFQDNGGIVISILAMGGMVAFLFAVVRAVDWMRWHKELKRVSDVASADVGQHEINFHEDEILHSATVERLTALQKRLSEKIKEKKLGEIWTGEERRAA